MRRKFRGRAVVQKETAVDPTSVRFPESYEQGNRIGQSHHVRIGRLKRGLDQRHSHTVQIGSIGFDDGTMTDTKGVRMIIPCLTAGISILRSIFLQLHITVEKTIQYDDDDDRVSGPSSDPNSPAMYPLTPTNMKLEV
jgi:hypothetical protein